MVGRRRAVRVELTVGRRPDAVEVGCAPLGGRVSGGAGVAVPAAAGATRPARSSSGGEDRAAAEDEAGGGP